MKTFAIVNNEEAPAELVRFNLERAGIRGGVYLSGVDALQALIDEPPDVVMLDSFNPPLGGVALLRREHCDMAVIFLTPHAEGVARELLGTILEAHDYISCPFSVADMVDRVRAMLDRNSTA